MEQSKSLFNISVEHRQLMELLLQNEGEITPEIGELLKINEQELTTKGVSYSFIIKSLEADISIIDSEIERLKKHKTARENAIERLKDNLKEAMEVFQVEEIKSAIMKINFRASESVEITDVTKIDKKFIVTKTTESVNKDAIKKAIKTGEVVAGAKLNQNKNLQIR